MPPIAILFIVTFTSMLGFGLLIPLTPAFAMQFHLTKIEIGILGAIFPFMQIISSIILGIISDKIGRRKTIYYSYFVVTISYILLAISSTFTGLLLSRAMAGFFSGSIVAAMAGASDLSTEKTRLKYMGLIGMAFGLGFMLGPTIGGILAGGDISNVNITLVSAVSASISLLAALLALFYLPETRPDMSEKMKQDSSSSWTLIIDSLKNKITLLHFTLNATISTIFATLEVYVSVVSASVFKFSPFNTGMYWAVFALVLNFGRIALLKPLGNYYGLTLGFFVIAISILFYIPGLEVPIKWLFYVASAFIAIMAGLIITLITSKVSLQGSPHTQGLIFGFNNSLGNLGRFAGPFFLGMVWQVFHSIIAVWIVTSIISLLGAFMSYYLVRHNKRVS